MTDLTISASSYALLQCAISCWKCFAATTVTAIWVPRFIDNEDEEYPEEGGAALLKYVSELDIATMAHVRAASPYRGPTFGLRLEHEENELFWHLQGETALPVASRTQASASSWLKAST